MGETCRLDLRQRALESHRLKELGFDYALGNRLNVRGGELTGGVTINISHGAKGKALKNILKRFNAKPKEMIAVGDSEGDVPMIKMAGHAGTVQGLSFAGLRTSRATQSIRSPQLATSSVSNIRTPSLQSWLLACT